MSAPSEISPLLLSETPLPSLDGDSDKHARGHVLLLAGSAQAPGAAVLAGLGALRAGAGVLRIATALHAPFLAFAIPEAAVVEAPGSASGQVSRDACEALSSQLEKADAIVLGPGMLDEDEAGALALALLRRSPETPMVIDAAAMVGLAKSDGAATVCGGRCVLTPHAGELAQMMGCEIETIRGDPLAAARLAARRFDAVVIAKGQDSYIVAPNGDAWVNRGGVSGLGASGSGDVLAGVIGGLLARGALPHVAAIWGVWTHAEAGRRLGRTVGPLGFLAREILAEIPGRLAAP